MILSLMFHYLSFGVPIRVEQLFCIFCGTFFHVLFYLLSYSFVWWVLSGIVNHLAGEE